jgi:hypothetical protein
VAEIDSRQVSVEEGSIALDVVLPRESIRRDLSFRFLLVQA